MSQVLWVALLKPIGLLVLFGAAYPFKVLVQRKMRDGKMKRLLLRRVGSAD
jgi:hypothetical protein